MSWGLLSPCHHFLVCDDRWEQVIPGPASLGNSGLMVLIAFGGGVSEGHLLADGTQQDEERNRWLPSGTGG